MKYENYIFDLYGTLVDIHTDEEKTELWEGLAGRNWRSFTVIMVRFILQRN